MFVFCIRAPFWKNGCYGVKYGHLSNVRPSFIKQKTKKPKCDKAVSRSQISTPKPSLLHAAARGQKASGLLFSPLASRTMVLRSGENKALLFFLRVSFFLFLWKINRGCYHLYFLCVKQVGFCAILRQ